jgi:hypothetical protein
MASIAGASNITYTLNRTIGAGSVTGTVTTDGTTGALTDLNFVDWSLVLSTPSQGAFDLFGPLSGNNSVVWSTGSDISATSTQLLFNYSGSDLGVLVFQQGLFSGNHYYCSATASAGFYCGQGEDVVPLSVFVPGAINAPRTGNIVIGTAGSTAAPEPNSLALLASGLLATAGAIRRKFTA